MQLMAQSNRREAAIRHFQDYQQKVAADLGDESGQDLTGFYQRLQAGESINSLTLSETTSPPPANVNPHDKLALHLSLIHI